MVEYEVKVGPMVIHSDDAVDVGEYEFADGVIHPTHNCFDDVTEYVNDLARSCQGKPLDELVRECERHTVVHAILVAPEGKPFAHAWLERDGQVVIQAGIWRGQPIRFELAVAEFRAAHTIRDETRYTVRETVELQRRHGLPPWKQEYRELCADYRKEPAP